MKKHLAILLGTLLLLLGCDMFISRGGEGQPCFSKTSQCSVGLICDQGTCVREVPDGDPDGGDEPGADDGGVTDAGDDAGGGDDGGSAGDDGGDDAVTSPVHIYRSVGPGNETALVSTQSGPNLVISGHTATFPNALPTYVGVGDAIQFDTVEDWQPDTLVFIHQRNTSTEVVVANADGTPADLDVDTATWGVLRAYTSLANAVTMVENPNILIENFDDADDPQDLRDLATHNLIWNIACYAGSSIDDTKVTIDHWTTSEDNYLRIFTPVEESKVGARQRHSGVWETSAYRLDVLIDLDYNTVIGIGDAHVHIDGLQIGKSSGTFETIALGIKALGTTNLRLSNSIIRGNLTEGQGVFVGGSAKLYMWNSIVYKTAATNGDGIHLAEGAQAFIYNVTLFDNYRGIYVDGNAGTDIFVRNVIAAGNVGTGGYDFDNDATFGNGSAKNCSSDMTAGGGGMAGGITGVEPTELFEDHTTDPPDLHLKSTSTCNGAGLNLKDDPDLSFLDDIDGNPRPTGAGLWDIGADENGQ